MITKIDNFFHHIKLQKDPDPGSGSKIPDFQLKDPDPNPDPKLLISEPEH